MPESIRLVIWDLDGTFWRGTLSEGGIFYRPDAHDIVVTLARRGIISSICSKNDAEKVRPILEEAGIWDFFVFPSITWESKGPRLAALVEAVQLRAPSILFIDDNPQNLGEAQYFVPGIQVAPETFIENLLDDPRFVGKPDPSFTRLTQYRLLETRQQDAAQAGGDSASFLRESGIRVTIEHDIEPHLDRAIELINRTNQLNFTKNRLPEDIDEARVVLRQALCAHQIQAGIIHVQDRYGDYGYCGFYMIRSGGFGCRLLHFCFSCRILNMGIETWLFQRLDCPQISVRGEVLTNLFVHREIDWITVTRSAIGDDTAGPPRALGYIYARGGCDLHAVTHYFTMVADAIHAELNTLRNGVNIIFQHSMFARYAIAGIAPEARKAMCALGYRDEDFQSLLAYPPHGVRGVWLLSFWADPSATLFRHKATGATLPSAIPGLRRPGIAGEGPAPEAIQRDFDFVGAIREADFIENVTMILQRAPVEARVFILLADDGGQHMARSYRRLNDWTMRAAAAFSQVTLLRMRDFVLSSQEVSADGHHDRMVYYRVYERIMRHLNEADA